MAEAAAQINGWERAFMAAERVKERLRRSTRALDAAWPASFAPSLGDRLQSLLDNPNG